MGPQVLKYGEDRIEYEVRQRPEIAGKVSIHVHPDGLVQVDAPAGATPEKVRAAVRKRARWISGHVEKIRERQADLLPRRYISGESHFYLGRRHMLKVVKSRCGDSKVRLQHGRLIVTTVVSDPVIVRDLLESWYRAHAYDRFTSRLSLLAPTVPWVRKGLPQIKLLNMKKHWGSCSPMGHLVLNPRLVKAPRECVDYVIVHELCHLKEHNHSKRFYTLLDRLRPDWRAEKRRLDDLAEVLLNV